MKTLTETLQTLKQQQDKQYERLIKIQSNNDQIWERIFKMVDKMHQQIDALSNHLNTINGVKKS